MKKALSRGRVLRTTIYVPLELHCSLIRIARERYCSISELLRESAEAYLKEALAKLRAEPGRAERLGVKEGRQIRLHQGYFGGPRMEEGPPLFEERAFEGPGSLG